MNKTTRRQDVNTILRMINICESLFVHPNLGSIKISMDYISPTMPNFEQLMGYKLNSKYDDISKKKPMILECLTFDCNSFKELRSYIDFIYNGSANDSKPQDFRSYMTMLNKIEIVYYDSPTRFDCTITKNGNTMKMPRNVFIEFEYMFSDIQCRFDIDAPLTPMRRIECSAPPKTDYDMTNKRPRQ